MKNNFVLTIKEMMHLKSLGINASNASAVIIRFCHSVRDYRKYFFYIKRNKHAYQISYSNSGGANFIIRFEAESLIEVSYNMLCWLAENGYLGKEEIG